MATSSTESLFFTEEINRTVQTFHTKLIAIFDTFMNILSSLHDMHYEVPSTNSLMLAKILVESFDYTSAVQLFIKRSFQSWKLIQPHDVDLLVIRNYFCEHASQMFQGIPGQGHIDSLASFLVRKDDKTGEFIVPDDTISELLIDFREQIRQSILYIHFSMQPLNDQQGQGYEKFYGEIDPEVGEIGDKISEITTLQDLAKDWGLTLIYE